ncbi:uncharacterized protein LOC135390627 [Ornithodoros turicata]|uniref:uncharacterized protein LOC135390627 n=1 Tax=Ornithodoros turicata TaxID=34597 RepID=UPI00313A0D0C
MRARRTLEPEMDRNRTQMNQRVLPPPLNLFPTGTIDPATGLPLVQFFDHATGTPILARMIDSTSGHPMLMDVYGRLYNCGNTPLAPQPLVLMPTAPTTSTNVDSFPPVRTKSSKGILKPARSFEYKVNREGLKWDEQNILKTLHPPDKDYGFISVKEPKPPSDSDPAGGTEFGHLLQRIEQCAENSAQVVAPLQVPESTSLPETKGTLDPSSS